MVPTSAVFRAGLPTCAKIFAATSASNLSRSTGNRLRRKALKPATINRVAAYPGRLQLARWPTGTAALVTRDRREVAFDRGLDCHR
jgi:hypothetical protein